MADEIRPALTPDEWFDLERGKQLTFLSDDGLQVCDAGDGTKFYVRLSPRAKTFTADDGASWGVAEIDRWDTDGLAQLAAMLLSHLPVGHPLKITHRDVELVRALVRYVNRDEDDPELCGPGEALAAKLAALLPPG
ncbi:MAG: hypothetical protein ABS52_19495 [Gemmatimonadetes bacterium SCN 70-22]|nr:MAG: hypothetical protein ABS52_19495 [Gemmatimonadetes bacterium SCN 70-22]